MTSGLFFIKNAENLNVIPKNVIDEGLQEAYKEAERQNWTKPELEDYERASMKEGDEKNRLAKAIRIGVEQGAKETAKNFRNLGVDIEIIKKATGLFKDEIESL